MPGRCQWCGEPATQRVQVAPADINTRTKTVRKPEVTACACDHHANRVQLNSELQDAETRLHRARKGADRTENHTPRHQKYKWEITKAEDDIKRIAAALDE